jgi:hypothetical protein
MIRLGTLKDNNGYSFYPKAYNFNHICSLFLHVLYHIPRFQGVDMDIMKVPFCLLYYGSKNLYLKHKILFTNPTVPKSFILLQYQFNVNNNEDNSKGFKNLFYVVL